MNLYNPYLRTLEFLQILKESTLIAGKDILIQYDLFDNIPMNPIEVSELLHQLRGEGIIQILAETKRSEVEETFEGFDYFVGGSILIDSTRLTEKIKAIEVDIRNNSQLANDFNTNEADVRVHLIKNDTSLVLKSELGDILFASLRPEGNPELILGYLMGKTDIIVTIQDIRIALHGLDGVTDLSDLIRKVGFDKELKGYFFPVCTKDKIRLVNTAVIPRQLYKKLKRQKTAKLK